MNRPYNLSDELEKHFGLKSFRNSQEEIISSILDKRNTVVVMPTGGGKSLCYQLPAVLSEGTCLVISPLIALMKDQVDALARLDIRSTFINSSITPDEINIRTNNTVNGMYKLVYVAPERLSSRTFIDALRYMNISFLAVDEAHCISEWGHDFRPSYLNIKNILDIKKDLCITALTATATPDIIEDIMKQLAMANPAKFVKGFDRPNLRYLTEEVEYDKLGRVNKIISGIRKGSTIIYCGTRNKVETYVEALNRKGTKALAYHAGLDAPTRRLVQDRFINSDVAVIVATNAFGMGIDKPDVRAVIHCDLTSTIESYYQEAGRAGRDGLPSACHLLYHESDSELQHFFINCTYPVKDDIVKVYNAVYDACSAKIGSKPVEALYIDEARIATLSDVNLSTVSSIIKLFEKNNILRKVAPRGSASVRFTTSRERITEFFDNATDSHRTVLEAILRSVSSEAFSNFADFSLDSLLNKFNITHRTFNDAVRTFEYLRLISYNAPNSGSGMLLLDHRRPSNAIPFDYQGLEKRKDHSLSKLDSVIRYAVTDLCKRNYILSYFRDNDYTGTCGTCSSCNSVSENRSKSLKGPSAVQVDIINGVYVLDGRFGLAIVTDFLRGIGSDRIRKYRLDGIPGFGICSKTGKHIFDEELTKAFHSGWIALSPDLYPTVLVNELYLKYVDKKYGRYKPETVYGDREAVPDAKLYEVLSALADDLAAKEGVISSAIIDRSSLRRIASLEPSTISELKQAAWLSDTFIAKFGNTFIHRIADYRSHRQKSTAGRDLKLSPKLKNAAELINSGTTVKDTAARLKTDPGTLVKELSEAIENGLVLKLDKQADPEAVLRIERYLKQKPSAKLKDIVRDIAPGLDFATLRLVVTSIRKDSSA